MFTSKPICPEGTLELVLIDFAFRTTLFTFVPDGDAVHSENDVFPLVEPIAVRGIAKPSVSEREIPIMDDKVSLLQNTPKSNPSPANPTVESACLALSTFAKYAYQLPSVAWVIRNDFPLIVTSGSPLPSPVSDRFGSITTTSTTIEPEKELSNWEFSAETNRFGLLDASASSIGIVNNIEKMATNTKYFKSNMILKGYFITNNVVV